MKLKTQPGGNVRVGILFSWQRHIKAYGFCPHVKSTPVGRLHPSRSTTGHHHQARIFWSIARIAHQLPQLTRHMVIARHVQTIYSQAFGTLRRFVIRLCRQRLLRGQQFALRRFWLLQARAAKHHDGAFYTVVCDTLLGFKVIQLQTHAARIVLMHKTHILIGFNVRRIFHNQPLPFCGSGFA